jgi:DNA-binding XRE family transcriptional regulator
LCSRRAADCGSALVYQEGSEDAAKGIGDSQATAVGGQISMTHDERKQIALSRPGVKAAYEALGPEFELLHALLEARQKAGLTQAQVADRMGTKASAVARLESALINGKHSPSIATLRKYARAVNRRLEIRLVA